FGLLQDFTTQGLNGAAEAVKPFSPLIPAFLTSGISLSPPGIVSRSNFPATTRFFAKKMREDIDTSADNQYY
ncbi:MAG TPA: hypothetical protein VMU88_08015, partial [bacterium]|nr:hypothetical protein [bacterium]